MRKFAVSTLCVLAACAPSAKDTDLKPLMQDFQLDKIQTSYRTRYLEALEKYAAADVKSGHKSLYAQSLTMVGRADIPFVDKVLRAPRNICGESDTDTKTDPIEALLEAIGERTLVIINEDHKMPRDRAFILDLLPALKAKGFTHYAAETFQHSFGENGIRFTSAADYSLVSDGYYSSEPIFGRLVSMAKNDGWQLVAYEQIHDPNSSKDLSPLEGIKARENAQSDHLISYVLGAAPNTKMIVHVGHSHVAEVPIKNRNSEGSTKWMAALLKEKTGIDPFTISQTACRSSGSTAHISEKVLTKDNESVTTYTDYALGHLPLSFSQNRPIWRREIGDMDVKIPTSLTHFSEPVLIEARLEGRPDSSVPIDRLLIREGEGHIPLLLPTGRYRVEAFNETGRVGDIEVVSVADQR